MKITALERWRGRLLRVVLDDGEALLLDRRTVEESPYTVGSALDDEALAAMVAASQHRRAREYALYLLSLRDYGEVELCRKLREKGYSDEATEVVARLKELGLQNDEVYARRLARDCRLRKLYSRRRTVQELCARGVARDTAEDAVENVDAAENLTDLQQALALLRKKRYNAPITEPIRRRGSSLLQRNGYDFWVLRHAWQELEADADEECIEVEEDD